MAPIPTKSGTWNTCVQKSLLAKNEKLTTIICTETFVDDLLSIKLSFENVFLFPRRHLYLIHILWIIEKHKYDKSAELRRIKSLWIGEWMDLLSPSQQNDFPIYIKPIKTNQRVLFSLAEGWPCWKKINLFFTISCNNEYFQVCIHEVFKRTHFGTYLKIYILVNLKMKTHMTNTIYNLQKPILEMFQYLFISRLYALCIGDKQFLR